MCDGYVTFAFVRLGIATLRIRRVERCPGKKEQARGRSTASHRVERIHSIEFNMHAYNGRSSSTGKIRRRGLWVAGWLGGQDVVASLDEEVLASSSSLFRP